MTNTTTALALLAALAGLGCGELCDSDPEACGLTDGDVQERHRILNPTLDDHVRSQAAWVAEALADPGLTPDELHDMASVTFVLGTCIEVEGENPEICILGRAHRSCDLWVSIESMSSVRHELAHCALHVLGIPDEQHRHWIFRERGVLPGVPAVARDEGGCVLRRWRYPSDPPAP